MAESTGAHPGQQAPEIDLPAIFGERVDRWRLSDYRGRIVVLIFYPADETAVCTKQLCSVRDRWADYRRTGAEVVGINTDGLEKHRRFIAGNGFPFPLLADEDGQVAQACDMKNLLGVRRGVIIIDGEESSGIGRWSFPFCALRMTRSWRPSPIFTRSPLTLIDDPYQQLNCDPARPNRSGMGIDSIDSIDSRSLSTVDRQLGVL
ncbi:MAG: peroxiredoxin [Blastocatellia bacterium]